LIPIDDDELYASSSDGENDSGMPSDSISDSEVNDVDVAMWFVACLCQVCRTVDVVCGLSLSSLPIAAMVL
jgi:hypothetical protein